MCAHPNFFRTFSSFFVPFHFSAQVVDTHNNSNISHNPLQCDYVAGGATEAAAAVAFQQVVAGECPMSELEKVSICIYGVGIRIPTCTARTV